MSKIRKVGVSGTVTIDEMIAKKEYDSVIELLLEFEHIFWTEGEKIVKSLPIEYLMELDHFLRKRKKKYHIEFLSVRKLVEGEIKKRSKDKFILKVSEDH